jgi:hypothetical protein
MQQSKMTFAAHFTVTFFQNLMMMYFWQPKLCLLKQSHCPSTWAVHWHTIRIWGRNNPHVVTEGTRDSSKFMLYPHKKCSGLSFCWKHCDWCSAPRHFGGIPSANCIFTLVWNFFLNRKFLHELINDGCPITWTPCCQPYFTLCSSSGWI